jgi:hypothetical protein
VPFIRERGFDRLCHSQLAFAKFVIRMPLGEQTLSAEELANGKGLGGHLIPDSNNRP